MCVAALEVFGLTKSYGKETVLRQMDLTVATGTVTAILGPNGAGKTTLLEIVEGLRKADAGEVKVLGYDLRKEKKTIKERIGIALQATSFFEHLSLLETLRLFGTFYQKHRSEKELLTWVDLWDRRDARIGQLSGGQQQRAALALSLVNDPDLLFLDEPTTGLDPGTRREIWDLVLRLKGEGRTIVLTTHYMEEAAILADQVIIMDHGQKIASGTVRELLAQYGRGQTITIQGEGLDFLQTQYDFVQKEDRFYRQDPHVTTVIADVYAEAARQGASIHQLNIQESTLEDVFLALTGRSLA